MRNAVRACALSALVVAMAPGAALADLSIDFETPALGECVTVTTQYSGVGFIGKVPYVRTAGVNHSGGHSLQSGANVCEEPGLAPHPIFTLVQTRAMVSLWARRDDDTAPLGYQLQAYDTENHRVDGNGSTYTQLNGTDTQLQVATSDNSNSIARVELVPQTTTLGAIRFDDLQLTDGPSPAQPDFSLGPAPTITVPQGGHTLVDVPINRFNGSTGRIVDLSVSNIPAGVDSVDNYGDATEDKLHVGVHASGSSPVGARGSMRVTARPPSAAAGPGPRPVDVPVVVTETPSTVRIDIPDAGTLLDRVPYDLGVSGVFSTPRSGDVQICTLVTQSVIPPAMPAGCNNGSRFGTNWRATIDRGFAPGQNYVHALLRDAGGYTASATRMFRIADETTGIDLRVTGLEVTQGPQRYTGIGGVAIPRSVGMNTIPYGGVQLVTRKATFVRVFANTNLAARSDGRTPGVTARLRVTRNGVEIPGSPFLPLNGPQNLDVGTAYVTDAERRNGAKGFLFQLPADAARGPLVLDATINDDTRRIAECPTCRPNDELRLTGLTFRPMKTLHIYPIRFTDDFDPSSAPMCDAPRDTVLCPRRPQLDVVAEFRRTREVLPFQVALHTWVSDVNITQDQMAFQRELAQWRRDHPMPGPDDREPRNEGFIRHWAGDYERDYSPPGTVLGVGRGSFAGQTSAPTVFCCSPLRIESYAIVDELRPLTSVAHEYGHVVGLAHADRGPDAPEGAADPNANIYGCQGGTHGQVADADFPDARGTVVGYAFDVADRRVLPAYGADGRAANYDFMSYCAADDNSWLSTRNWEKLIDEQNDGAATRIARQVQPGPAGPALSVAIRLDIDGSDGIITSLAPAEARAQASDPNGTYELVATGAGGASLSSTRVVPQLVHTRGGGVELVVEATIPAGAGTQAVRLLKDGQVVAERKASENAPTVKLLAPKPGTRVGRRGTLAVRWRAADADKDTLRYTIEQAVSPRGRFRMVGAGGSEGSAKLPVELLRPSSNARIRVRVTDGFHEATATSGRIRIAPRPPEVTIFAPQAGTAVRADAALALEGQAVDAANEMVGDKRLVWRDGRRVLGKGAALSVTGLSPGRRTITLTAQGGGAKGVARVRVRVIAVAPRLLTLQAPVKVGLAVGAVKLRLAASVPSRLTIRGGRGTARARLGRRVRTVSVKVGKGSSPLKLTLLLKAGAKTATVPLTIPRG